MKKKFQFTILIVLLLIVLITPEYAFAGPGGYVAKALFKTWWGKALMLLLAIILLPLIIYVRFREYFAIKKCTDLLNKVSVINRQFEYTKLHASVANTVKDVHRAWGTGQLDSVQQYMTDWYWQNQQLTILNEWDRQGLKNICNFYGVSKIKPLHVSLVDNDDFEGARIAFLVGIDREDYLIDKASKRIVHGAKGTENIEQIWIMEFDGSSWRLDDIQPSSLSLAFAKAKNMVPASLKEKVATLS